MSSRQDEMSASIDLASLLSIWPIAESFATQAPVGDLITLGRTSSSLRSSLHGRLPDTENPKCQAVPRGRSPLDPEIGQHQTQDWAHLKSLANYICSSTTHTRGDKVQPCVYCSKPICEPCIIRDSFAHRNENTYKNRLRFFCHDCWTDGRPSQSFRFPAIPSTDTTDSCLSRKKSSDSDKAYFEADAFCECTFKDNGWLCLDCKELQNTSPSAASKLHLDTRSESQHTVPCHGLSCSNPIDLTQPDRDRRRICLWCQKPVRRQWSGEDRYAWNQKTVEARARNAESRSRDLEEYNRRRLQNIRISRRELRGSLPHHHHHHHHHHHDDDRPDLLRHLDSFNYRNWIHIEESIPTPEEVWWSKNGFWRYRRGFLCAVQRRCRSVSFTSIGGVTVKDIAMLTRIGAPAHARLNCDVYPVYAGYGVPQIPELGHSARVEWRLNELRARIIEMHVLQGLEIMGLVGVLGQEYGVTVTSLELRLQLGKWREQGLIDPDVIGSCMEASEESTETMAESRVFAVSEVVMNQERIMEGAEPRIESLVRQLEPASVNGDNILDRLESRDLTNARDAQITDDPPPYEP